ncbi:MAG: HAMP domain-containing protein [Nitrospirae bacterium]|nr:HAMP domain-containing protein [Nitrospirota bacterium]
MAIRTRLAIWFSILVAVVLTLSALIRYTGYKQALQSRQDYSLRVVADILDSSIPRHSPTKNEVQTAVARMIREYPDIELKGILIEVYDSSRAVIFISSLSEAQQFHITEDIWKRTQHKEVSLTTIPAGSDNGSIRILTKPIFYRNKLIYIIQVGSSTNDIEETLESIFLFNILIIPLSILLIGIGGWFLAKEALKPLEAIITASHHISSGDLHHRIPASDTSSEISALTRAFNQMTIKLQSSFQQIKDFSENVSHELRIPLSILRGQTELSLKRSRPVEEYRNTLESNLEEILRMENIVERLLFLSKAERGELKLEKSELDIRDLSEWAFAQFKLQAQEKNINLILNSENSVTVYGDEVLLRELLLNLIKNAITYTNEGGSVSLSIGRSDEGAVISVADTGIGIPEKDIPHIFERFYQVDKSRSTQGSGLGLSICKWIVEAHNGKITVESAYGKGSEFSVFLPSPDRNG